MLYIIGRVPIKYGAVHNVNNGGAYSSAGATEHFPIASAK